MRVSNAYLARSYAEFNRKYFGNKLPRDMIVRFEKNMEEVAITMHKFDRPLYIELNEKLKWHNMLVDITLLHEMVHVESIKRNGHGPWFQKRMLKLAKDGAFKNCW